MVPRQCSSSARTLIHDALKARQTIQGTRGIIKNLRAFSVAAFNQPQPSPRHPPQTRSRYGITRPSGWEPRSLVAPCSDEDAVAYFARLLPPLKFPRETTMRMITHTSWRAGMEGNNNRFSFIGRRVLQAYMLAFLHAHTQLTPTPPLTEPPSGPPPDTQISHLPMPSSVLEQDFDEITNKAVNTQVLGSFVGNVWELERVMRWVPNRVGESISNDPGLYKIRGTTVEAVVGGVFHQFAWLHTDYFTPDYFLMSPRFYRANTGDLHRRRAGGWVDRLRLSWPLQRLENNHLIKDELPLVSTPPAVLS